MESGQDIEAGAPRGAEQAAARLRTVALIEWVGRDGRVLRTQPVTAWPVTLGRALDRDVVLDDTHVAAEHATLAVHNGVVQVHLGATINGAAVGHKHLSAGQAAPLAAGEVLRLGTTRLRVRLATDALAPEQALTQDVLLQSIPHPVAPTRWLSLAGWMVVLALVVFGEHWLDTDPGTPASAYLNRLLAAGGALAAWSLLWALVSKLFMGRIDYLAHLRTVLVYSLLWTALGLALPAGAFVLGWPGLSKVSEAVSSAVICALLLAHLSLVLPSRRRALAVGFASLYVTAVGLTFWLNQQQQGRWFSELYVSTLLPPSWRVAATVPPATLLQDVQSLQAGLDQRVKDDQEADDADVMEAD